MASLNALIQSPMQSKKFIAFFLCLILSRVGIVVMVKADSTDMVIISALLCATFVDVGYILGQAALDIYVRGIASARGDKTGTET